MRPLDPRITRLIHDLNWMGYTTMFSCQGARVAKEAQEVWANKPSRCKHCGRAYVMFTEAIPGAMIAKARKLGLVISWDGASIEAKTHTTNGKLQVEENQKFEERVRGAFGLPAKLDRPVARIKLNQRSPKVQCAIATPP